MSNADDGAFGRRQDGSLSRRDFVVTASRLGMGLFGTSALGMLAACGSSEPQAERSVPGGQQSQATTVGPKEGESFRLGWIRPTTGRLSSSFAPLYIGGLIAIEEINAQGGIMGHQIVRQEEDDEASPAKEPAVVKKLQEAGINYVFGPTGSSQVQASLGATTPARMIQATYANAAELEDGGKYPYHYQGTFNTNQQGAVAAAYMVEQLKVKKVGILQENTAFGEEAARSSKATLGRLGATVTGTEVYPIDAPDLAPYVRNLKNAGSEGVLAWMANLTNSASAFNAMKGLSWTPPITGHNGLFVPKIFELVSPESLTNVYATYYRAFSYTATQEPGARQLAHAEKIARFPEAKGFEPNIAASPYYDFLHLLKQVIEDEKTFDTTAVKRALDNTTDYDGMIGRISFTATDHTAVPDEEVVLASVLSGRDPKARGAFRERAPGI